MARPRPPHPAPRIVTIASRPFWKERDGRFIIRKSELVNYYFRNSEYFSTSSLRKQGPKRRGPSFWHTVQPPLTAPTPCGYGSLLSQGRRYWVGRNQPACLDEAFHYVSDRAALRGQPETLMTQPTAKRFPTPPIASLPEDIRTRILAVQEKSGFVPNVFLTLAYRPDEFRAFFAYHDALMERDSGLTKAEREMIVVATSSANQCHYCVIAHGAILRIRAKNPEIADQIAINYRKADITPRQKAMLDFAMKVSAEAQKISEADFIAVASHGFSDDDIWDIAAISAFFALSNRMANVTAMRPNDEFYMMGRVLK
jgi:uncharacterized peroxidase-related enzyme